VVRALRGEGHSPRALAEAAAASRHEAAEHLTQIGKERPWKVTVGVIAAVVAFLAALTLGLNRLGQPARVASAVNASDAQVITAKPGQIGLVNLDDGTAVRLAPDSRLSIPKQFGAKMRAVKLEGIGSFTVAPNQEGEFQVLARDAVIAATGTSFTVSAYPGDESATIVVNEGAVEVRRGKQIQAIGVGRAVVLLDSATTRAATTDERDAADAWRNGTLAVTRQKLGAVLPQLRRWYGLEVGVQQPPLLDREVSFRASLDSSRQAIRGIEQSTGLEFGYVGQNAVFRVPAAGKK
jgi:ferric-dicitrate binding protein FerR (iron transport regulator)